MTSKNLFFKLIKQDFQKRIWCPLLLFIAYFVAMEVRMLMMFDRIKEGWYADYYTDLLSYTEKTFWGTDIKIISIFTCFAAFLCAMSGFSYLHSKIQLDMYHSLPVNRIQLFISKYISGILWHIVPFVIHTFICMGIAAGKGAFSYGVFVSAMKFIGVTLIIFLLTYAVFIVAICLTGNIVISMIGSVVLFFYSMMISFLVEMMYDRFFHSFTYSYTTTEMLGRFWSFSPCAMLIKLFENDRNIYGEYFKYNEAYLRIIAAGIIVYTLLAFFLYWRRASEMAGKAIAFSWMEPVLKTLIVIPLAFYSGLFFEETASGDSDIWYLFGIVFGYIILALVTETIFRFDIKSAFMHKRQFIFNAVCVMLIFIAFKYDIPGYDEYVPEETKLVSCSVSINELMSTAPTIYGRGYYIYNDATRYRMENVKIQGNQNVILLAQKAAADTYSYDEITDDEERQKYRTINFGYNLKNNKTVYRKYMIDITDKETMELLGCVFDDEAYKAGINIILNEGWKKEYKKIYCTGSFRYAMLDMTPELQEKLLEVYREEYLELDFSTVLDTYPVGSIRLFTQEDYDKAIEWGMFNDKYDNGIDGCLVYPQFVKTIALLKENGFDMQEKISPDEIDYIKVERRVENRENKYITYDYVDVAEVKDADEKERLLDIIFTSEYEWQVGSYTDFFDDEFKVYIYLKSSGKRMLTEYKIKKGMVPETFYGQIDNNKQYL